LDVICKTNDDAILSSLHVSSLLLPKLHDGVEEWRCCNRLHGVLDVWWSRKWKRV